jgi:WD40 repeat protein
MDNLSGQTLKTTYRILERIGAGGFGAVYRATQIGIDREVAIKIILPEHANTSVFIQRFETEAQLVARLEHPHIVPLYDYWREPGGAYLVMRYLRGGSVRAMLEHLDKGWKPALVGQMLAQIGSALTFAHSNGVVHRDLKTDNILLDEQGNCYLGDFGIAKNLGGNLNLTADAILGTPAYLSPEQIRGEDATTQSDIYAFGIVAYEALTGVKPFYDLTPATVLFKQLHDPLPDVTMLVPSLPTTVNNVLQRATSKDPSQRYTTAIDFAVDFQRALRDKLSPAEMNSPANGQLSTAEILGELADSQIVAKNPYKGLRAFQQADAGDFFGRRSLVERLIRRVKQTGQTEENVGFLAVVGPSGSGKSSVVRAGLLPAIRNGELDESLVWYVTEMIPGTHPMEEMEAALLSIATTDAPDLLKILKEDTRGFIRAVRRVMPGDNSRLVLLIDQFEELFTLVEGEETRQHFLNTLLETANDPRSRIVVLITLRADFYDKPLLYAGFGDLIRRRTELVLPLSQEELEEAILGPATRVGVQTEPGLTQAIITEVVQQPGALPLLQYALTELYERREGRRMTLNAYQQIGGTAGALARRADDVYEGFDEATQAEARQMFMRLVTLGDGTEDTRRRVLQSELLSIAGVNNMSKIIETFGKYRLLTFDHDPLTRGATVEVAHEALIRQWERMRNWLEESREGLRLQRRLASSAEEWIRSGRERSFLARGLQLQQFEQRAELQGIALNALESEYQRASIMARDALLEEERQRKAREEALERRAANRLRFLAAFMFISAVIGIGLALYAFSQRQEAETERVAAEGARQDAEQALIIAEKNEAENSSLALAANARNAQAEGNMPLALALALEAEKAFTPQPVEVLRVLAGMTYAPGVRYRLNEHTGSVVSVAFAPDGTSYLSAGADGILVLNATSMSEEIWRVETGKRITTAEFAPDGAVFAAALDDFSVRLYDTANGAEIRAFEGHEMTVNDLEFTSDGKTLVSVSDDHTIRLWNVTSGKEERRFEGSAGALLRLAIAPVDSVLVTTSADETIKDTTQDIVDRVVLVWDMATGEIKTKIDPKSGFIRALAVSPDGTTISIGIYDGTNRGTIRFYSITTGEETARLYAHTDILTDVVYSPDGRYIASTSWQGDAQVWDIARGLRLQQFVGFPDRILSLDYSPNGEYLVVGSGNTGNNDFVERAKDTSVFLIDLKNRDEITTLRGHADWVWTVDISPDGTKLATGSGPLRYNAEANPLPDTSVRIWDAATHAEIAQLVGHTNTVDSVVFLPDNERVLSSAWDTTIILWDIAKQSALHTYTGHEGAVYDLSLSADGSQFLSASGDGTVRLWDTESGDELKLFDLRPFGTDNANAVNGVRFSPDETRFVTGSADKIVRVWDVATGEVVLTLEGHTETVNETIYSPDGTIIASSSWDDSIRLWDAATGKFIRTLTGHNGNTFGLVFTADNAILLSTSQDTTIRMWKVATGEELHRFQGHSDWVQEVDIAPDGLTAFSGAQDRLAKLWRLNLTAEQLSAFAAENRYIRDLTCVEKVRYRVESDECTAN